MQTTVMAPVPAFRSAFRNTVFVLLGGMALAGCQSRGPDLVLDAPDSAPAKRMVTQGPAKTIIAQNLTSLQKKLLNRCHLRQPCKMRYSTIAWSA